MICLVERRVREGAVGFLKAAHLKGPPCLPEGSSPGSKTIRILCVQLRPLLEICDAQVRASSVKEADFRKLV